MLRHLDEHVVMYREVPNMRKLKALFLALCFILAILIFNIPRINFGHGPDFVSEQSYDVDTKDNQNNK